MRRSTLQSRFCHSEKHYVSPLNFDDVVALNALIVTAIGFTLFLSRRERKPPTLNLTGPRRSTAADEISPRKGLVPKAGSACGGRSATYGANALRRLEEEVMEPNLSLVESRQLNVFFNWNGHTWDAYEVLGVPAGAARETVIQAFHQCRAKSPDSTAFLQAATDAILKRR